MKGYHFSTAPLKDRYYYVKESETLYSTCSFPESVFQKQKRRCDEVKTIFYAGRKVTGRGDYFNLSVSMSSSGLVYKSLTSVSTFFADKLKNFKYPVKKYYVQPRGSLVSCGYCFVRSIVYFVLVPLPYVSEREEETLRDISEKIY